MEEGPFCPICDSPIDIYETFTTAFLKSDSVTYNDEMGRYHNHDTINFCYGNWRCTNDPVNHKGAAEHMALCGVRNCEFNEGKPINVLTDEQVKIRELRRDSERSTTRVTMRAMTAARKKTSHCFLEMIKRLWGVVINK